MDQGVCVWSGEMDQGPQSTDQVWSSVGLACWGQVKARLTGIVVFSGVSWVFD